MSALDDVLQLWVPALGWALLNFVWQGLLVGAIAALLLRLLRSAGPRSRYGVCGAALLLCLLLPALQLNNGLQAMADPPTLEASPEVLALAPDWLLTLQSLLPELVLAWCLGVALMALRLGLGLAWVARLRRASHAQHPQWQARLDGLARRMGLRGSVPLQVVDQLDSPLTVGWWRPVILVPAALISGMPVPLLEALLAHELAHVRRLDYLVNLLQSGIEALLFFHPVVWWLSNRMRREREQVADELAARMLDEPRRLALALHELTLTMLTSHPLTQSAQGGDLLHRIQQLLAPRRHTSAWKLMLPALALAMTSLLVQAHAPRAADKPKPVTAEAASTPFTLPVNARHALVLEDGTGRVLMEKSADAVVPIASLTKLMTAMVVLDAKPSLSEKIRIDRGDVDTLKHSASHVPVGAQMPRLAAMKLALMSSDNRAAAALARTYPGGLEAFELAVQAKIRALGLTHTSIAEPTGLSPQNTSTAVEVAKMAAAAANYPEIGQITSNRKALIPINGRQVEYRNTNRLVGSKGWDILLSKTGYTDEAGRCLTMRMKSGGKNVTVVLLDADGSADRLRDAAKIRRSLDKLHG
nr:M56 family metallopeptidase [uncultured Roseateles sp.]